MVALYRSGGTLEEVARLAGRDARRVREELLAAGVVLRRVSRRSRYPQLNDPLWLEAHLMARTLLLAMAREAGCDRWAAPSA